MVAMPPTLAANAGPVNARPGTQLHAHNWPAAGREMRSSERFKLDASV